MSELIDLGAELADYCETPRRDVHITVQPSGQPRSIGRLADMQQQGFAMLPDTTPLRRPTLPDSWVTGFAGPPPNGTLAIPVNRCHQCQRYLPDGPNTCPECRPELSDQPFNWNPLYRTGPDD